MLITLQKKEKNKPPFLGGKGGQIKLTLFLSGVGNHPTKLYIKFQNDKLKTLGVMSQKDKSQEKPKLFPKTCSPKLSHFMGTNKKRNTQKNT